MWQSANETRTSLGFIWIHDLTDAWLMLPSATKIGIKQPPHWDGFHISRVETCWNHHPDQLHNVVYNHIITTSMKKWIDLRPYLLEEVCFTTTHGVFSSGAPFINQFWYYAMAQNILWHQIWLNHHTPAFQKPFAQGASEPVLTEIQFIYPLLI